MVSNFFCLWTLGAFSYKNKITKIIIMIIHWHTDHFFSQIFLKDSSFMDDDRWRDSIVFQRIDFLNNLGDGEFIGNYFIASERYQWREASLHQDLTFNSFLKELWKDVSWFSRQFRTGACKEIKLKLRGYLFPVEVLFWEHIDYTGKQ